MCCCDIGRATDGSLFYIGFWLKDMTRLGSQLAGIMITGQLIRIAREHLLLQVCLRAPAAALRARILTTLVRVRPPLQLLEKYRWAKVSKQNHEFATALVRKQRQLVSTADRLKLAAQGLRQSKRLKLEFDSSQLNMVRRAIAETEKSATPNLIDECRRALPGGSSWH